MRWSFEIRFMFSKPFAREGEEAKGELETTLPKEGSEDEVARKEEEDGEEEDEEGEEREGEERVMGGEQGRPAIHCAHK